MDGIGIPVAIEIFRTTEDGSYEGCMVTVLDSQTLRCGLQLLLDGQDDDEIPWTLGSVHRCVEVSGKPADHSRCFV